MLLFSFMNLIRNIYFRALISLLLGWLFWFSALGCSVIFIILTLIASINDDNLDANDSQD
ncbi:hypothetical protein [Winogradskyella sp. 3972H.M.0a.05]|uniref:hypothetical protein n=1 Tax=Winogradskyella sp. 3972H.M.0a.05 TaxID=2950277 RepID=UPI00339ADAEC